jgi:hypothetical protein
MDGFVIVIILLVPIAFQIVMLNMKVDRKHKEIMDMLKEINRKLKS